MLASIPLWLLILLGLLTGSCIGLAWYLKKLTTRLDQFLQGKDATSLEAVLAWLTEKYSFLDDRMKMHKEALEQIDARVKRSIRTQSLVHYDAFENIGGNQSFASALLNEEGDGYILSIITHRSSTNLYAKKIPYKKQQPKASYL